MKIFPNAVHFVLMFDVIDAVSSTAVPWDQFCEDFWSEGMTWSWPPVIQHHKLTVNLVWWPEPKDELHSFAQIAGCFSASFIHLEHAWDVFHINVYIYIYFFSNRSIDRCNRSLAMPVIYIWLGKVSDIERYLRPSLAETWFSCIFSRVPLSNIYLKDQISSLSKDPDTITMIPPICVS